MRFKPSPIFIILISLKSARLALENTLTSFLIRPSIVKLLIF